MCKRRSYDEKVIDFIEKYDGTAIDDEGYYESDSYKEFAKELRSIISSYCRQNKLYLSFFFAHDYVVEGYIKRLNRTVSFRFNVPRENRPMDLLNGTSGKILYEKSNIPSYIVTPDGKIKIQETKCYSSFLDFLSFLPEHFKDVSNVKGFNRKWSVA